MNNATMASKRLQRVAHLLSDGREYTTRQIVEGARVMAVSACVAELRECGKTITCTRRKVGGDWLWFYRMV